MEKKHETFVYEGLGFPVQLIDCPMKKVLDEWVLDLNLGCRVNVRPQYALVREACRSFWDLVVPLRKLDRS